jgi:hypothetical protein
VIVVLAGLALWGYTRYKADNEPNPDNPLIGSWVVDMDAMTAMMSRGGSSQQDIEDFRNVNGQGRTGLVITKDTLDNSSRGVDGGQHPYTLDRIDASCFAVHVTDSGKTVDLCVQGNSMRFNATRFEREGPGLMLKRQ